MARPATSQAAARTQNIIVAIMAVVILGFCAFGFGSKFVELVRLVQTDNFANSEGVFVVAPLVNYLLASMGFLCLLGWAAAQGMFHNIEEPKQTMLDLDAQLDADNDDSKFSKSVIG